MSFSRSFHFTCASATGAVNAEREIRRVEGGERAGVHARIQIHVAHLLDFTALRAHEMNVVSILQTFVPHPSHVHMNASQDLRLTQELYRVIHSGPAHMKIAVVQLDTQFVNREMLIVLKRFVEHGQAFGRLPAMMLVEKMDEFLNELIVAV